jgi:phenylacetic acid degradation protein paaN
MGNAYFDTHKATLDKAVAAIHARTYWSPFAEVPSGKIYGETAAADGEAAFKARLNQPFDIDQPGSGRIGAERSPYGMALGITYPRPEIGALIAAAETALPAWRDAGPASRVGICLEILARLNRRSFKIAHAVMHTTGQGFMMAFQAGGPHAQDRGLEAVAYAWEAMSGVPEFARWEKPQGKNPPLVMDKTFRIVPRGVALVIGCATFPTWNGYPGLFASLATGNPVIVKPHPMAVLPLAITVEIARAVLKEGGFDPNLVTLAVDTADAPIAKELATRPEVKIIDFTGGSEFGNWLEANARQAQVYTEKSGVNAVVIGDFADFKGLARNLAFALSLYSGQMCTTPQNIFVPRGGIRSGDATLSFDQVAAGLADAVGKLLGDAERAAEVLGAIQNPATLERIEKARSLGKVVLDSQAITHPKFPEATLRTPLIVALDAKDEAKYGAELFGPIAFIIATDGIDQSIELMRRTIRQHGAITAAVYADDAGVLAKTEDAAAEAGVALSCNLTGGIFVNQSAAFSDFHATGANPAANAALTDPAFVAGRFRVVQSRIPVPAPAAAE